MFFVREPVKVVWIDLDLVKELKYLCGASVFENLPMLPQGGQKLLPFLVFVDIIDVLGIRPKLEEFVEIVIRTLHVLELVLPNIDPDLVLRVGLMVEAWPVVRLILTDSELEDVVLDFRPVIRDLEIEVARELSSGINHLFIETRVGEVEQKRILQLRVRLGQLGVDAVEFD